MYYAIGDIHGRYDLLTDLYNKIQQDIREKDDPFGNTIVFLGDYVDRGPNSLMVLRFLMNLNDTDKLRHVFVRGNHEEMLSTCAKAPQARTILEMWISNGGQKFLDEMGIPPKELFGGLYLNKELDFIDNRLVHYFETTDYLFVHGGINKMRTPEECDPSLLYWARFTDVNYYSEYRKMVIHGHTPTRNGLPQEDINRINVDTNAPYSNILTCVALPHVKDNSRYFITSGVFKAKG